MPIDKCYRTCYNGPTLKQLKEEYVMENRKIVGYITLQHGDGPQDRAVEDMISKGWQPYGLPTNTKVIDQSGNFLHHYWAQTMVRYQTEPKD